tara:strand:+ start:158 stop:913 length:756 start_codon:yes stop_codon:yes gene_type:complete
MTKKKINKMSDSESKAKINNLNSHFVELRKRIVFSIIIYLLATILGFVFHRNILGLMVEPVTEINQLTQGLPIYTNITEFWSVVMKVSLLSGLLLSFPMISYQVLAFALPGLKKNEKKFILILLPGSIISFYVGAAFGFFILLPPAIKFLVFFGGDISEPLIRIGSLVQLTINLMMWMGVCFQLPIIMYLLTIIKLVDSKKLSYFRKYFIIFSFILGAIITPTFDPINQIIVALPIMVLYEIGILLSKTRK